jgi:hypothetical protein
MYPVVTFGVTNVELLVTATFIVLIDFTTQII